MGTLVSGYAAGLGVAKGFSASTLLVRRAIVSEGIGVAAELPISGRLLKRQWARGLGTMEREKLMLLPETFSKFSRFEYHFNKHANKFGLVTRNTHYKRVL